MNTGRIEEMVKRKHVVLLSLHHARGNDLVIYDQVYTIRCQAWELRSQLLGDIFVEQEVWEVYPWLNFFSIHLRRWPLEGMPNGLVFYRIWSCLQAGLAWVRIHTLFESPGAYRLFDFGIHGWVSAHCVDLSGPHNGRIFVHQTSLLFGGEYK